MLVSKSGIMYPESWQFRSPGFGFPVNLLYSKKFKTMYYKVNYLIKGISLFFVLFFFGLNKIHAQENFVSGYIIETNGDSLNGFIDYRGWGKNPVEITFKRTMTEEKRIMTPTNIKEFGVAGEIYEGGIVDAETSTDRVSEMLEDKELHFRKDTVFLQAIIKGEKSFYYYKDFNDKTQLYIKDNNKFQWLTYKKYMTIINGEKGTVEIKQFLGQLAEYLPGCPNLVSQIRSVVYSKESILKIFKTYYGCSGKKASFEKVKEKTIFQLGIVGGIGSTKINFSSEDHNFDYLTTVSQARSSSPVGGIFFDMVFPRSQHHWSLRNELFYNSFKLKNSYSGFKTANEYSSNSYELAFSYLKLNTFIRYRIPAGRTSFFLVGGMANGIKLSEKNTMHSENYYYSITSEKDGKALSDTRSFQQSLTLGISVSYMRLYLEGRYESSTGIVPFSALGSSPKTFYLLLGYQIF